MKLREKSRAIKSQVRRKLAKISSALLRNSRKKSVTNIHRFMILRKFLQFTFSLSHNLKNYFIYTAFRNISFSLTQRAKGKK